VLGEDQNAIFVHLQTHGFACESVGISSCMNSGAAGINI